MGVGSGLYMYDVVLKRSRSLSHLMISSCITCPMLYAYVIAMGQIKIYKEYKNATI